MAASSACDRTTPGLGYGISHSLRPIEGKLILHFDINKTIIMSDPVSNIGVDKMLNSLLSECTWGVPKRTQKCTDTSSSSSSGTNATPSESPEGSNNQEPDNILWRAEDWTPYTTEPSAVSPVPGAVTYGEFLENFCKKTVTRDQRKKLKTAFTAPGGAGEQCKEALLKLQEAMTIPTGVSFDNSGTVPATAAAAAGGGGGGVESQGIQFCVSTEELSENKPLSEVIALLKSGQYHIVPSFFRLISHLDQNKVDFRIIFRTFGVDVARVAAEFNLYCEGKHPVYCRPDPVTGSRFMKMDGSEGSVDRRLKLPDHSGRLLRTAGEAESRSVHFAHVTAEKVSLVAKMDNIYHHI
jgi:hypothetical protein